MARQGRMHSSPFHIESSSYKYAIEHENDGYTVPNAAVICTYKKSKQNCRLWNSGFEKCAAFKCHFKQESMRRNGARCLSCAYCFNEKCLHPRKPPHENPDVTSAEYCHYFVCEADDRDKFKKIRQYETRTHLTALLDRKLKSIKIKENYIKEAEKKMSQLSPEDSDYTYFAGKIAMRREIIRQTEDLVVRIQADLTALGGELRERPQKKKSR